MNVHNLQTKFVKEIHSKNPPPMTTQNKFINEVDKWRCSALEEALEPVRRFSPNIKPLDIRARILGVLEFIGKLSFLCDSWQHWPAAEMLSKQKADKDIWSMKADTGAYINARNLKQARNRAYNNNLSLMRVVRLFKYIQELSSVLLRNTINSHMNDTWKHSDWTNFRKVLSLLMYTSCRNMQLYRSGNKITAGTIIFQFPSMFY